MDKFETQKAISNFQTALKDLQAGRDINIRDVIQTIKLIINLPQPERFMPEGIPANLPSSNTVKFVGREKTLLEVHEKLRSGRSLMVTAVKGMGGVGKTELATQYAWLYYLTEAYQGGICWVRARNEEISLQITGFAREKFDLQIPDDKQDPVERVQFCWSRWLAGDVLLVFDDVTDYRAIIPYLPQEPRFKVLVTTRLDLDLPQKIALDVLDPQDWLQLLTEWIGQEKVAAQETDALELGERLGYLPLALNLVGRYVQKRKISLEEMLKRLEAQGLEHQALDIPTNDKTWALQIERGVKAAFELSWAELSEDAQILGMLLAVFALAPIPWDLVESVNLGWEQERLEEARIELEGLHLLQEQVKGYQLHQLIRAFLQGKLGQFEQMEDLKRGFVAVMVARSRQIESTLTLTQIESLEPYTPHLMEVAEKYCELLRDEDCEILGIFTSLARFYENQALYSQAEIWRKACLSQTETRLGADHPDTATSLNNLALLYRSQGRYSEAESSYRQSLAIDEKLYGDDHLSTATSLNNLGALYESQGRYSEAEPLFRRSLEIREEQLEANHPSIATSLNNLAALYRSQGEYSKAEILMMQSFVIREKQLGTEHPDTAQSLNNLAELYQAQGRYFESELLYKRSLSIKEKQLGADHPTTATSLNNLAGLYQSQGRYTEADLLYQQALVIKEKQLGADHPDIAASLNNLAELYRSQGQYSKAEPLFRRSLAIREKQLGGKHPDTAHSLNNLAGLYQSQGRYSDAESLFRRSLAIREQQLGTEHPDTAQSLNNLAGLYYLQKRYTDAEFLFHRSLKIREKQLGINHPDTAYCLNNIAGLYKSQGKKEQALEFYQRALDIFEQRLGTDHPNTITVRNNLRDLQNQNNLPQPSRRTIFVIIVNILKSPFYLLWQGFLWLRRHFFGR